MGDTSYSEAINKNAPSQGADLLRARAQNGKLIVEKLADWLKDYVQLQKRHSAEIERFLAKHVVDEQELGTLAEPWQRIAFLVAEQCRLTSDSARRVQIEAERPIRENAYYNRAESAIAELARCSSDKSYGASSASAGNPFTQIQKLDFARLENIKNSLLRFATVEVDRAQSQMAAAERAMQAWLVYDPQDDLASFIAQIVSGVAPLVSASNKSVPQPVGSRQVSQASQSTVRRRASRVFLGASLSSNSESQAPTVKSPSSNLRSKVGSIFGRKKRSQLPVRGEGGGGAGNDSGDRSNPLTLPPDFGPRQHSQLSLRTQSTASSQLDLYAPSSPRRPEQPKPPLSAASDASNIYEYNKVTNSMPPQAGPQIASQGVTLAAPLAAPKGPPEGSNSFTGEFPSTFSSEIAPLTPTKARQSKSLRSSSPIKQEDYFGDTTANSHEAPAPPPARSVYRQNSLNRNSSVASANRAGSQGSASRDARVNSHVFSSLPPATESERNSIVQDPEAYLPSDKLGPLPTIPATPHAPESGSPEQFWTPAAKFPTQFSSFSHIAMNSQAGIGAYEQANTSLASLTSARVPILPPLPSVEGLVAAAVEHIEAEYEGEVLVRSSVRGQALAQINGVAPAVPSLVLGILLAEPHAQLVPNALLKQTSSLSFDVPVEAFSAPHELLQYTSESAVGRVPLKVTPVWRFDSTTVRLVLSFQLSDLYVGGDEVEIVDLSISVSIRGSAKAHAAQSKPVATFSREKQRVTWRLSAPQIVRRSSPATKLLCQFVTDHAGAEPGPIELKARMPVTTHSVLQLRTLGALGDWVAVPTAVATDFRQSADQGLPPSIAQTVK